MLKYTTLDNLKQKNVSDILLFIMERGKTYRREIQANTGFSWGAVSNSVAKLIESGYVKEVDCDNAVSGVGRKTSYLTLCGDKVVGLGIDVNGSGIDGVIAGFDGTLIYSRSFEFDATSQPQLVKLMENVIDQLILVCKNKYQIKSLGISFQGEIDGEEGVSYTFPSIKDWEPFNVKEYFYKKYSIPIYFEHDPKCMLYSLKAVRGLEDVLLIRADEGIGLAVMQNGKIMQDKKKLELGHFLFYDKDKIDKTKDLEYFASGRGISKRANVPFNEIIKAPQKVADLIERATDYLSLAVYNLYVLFRPQKIILTGQMFSVLLYEKSFKQKFSELNSEVEIVTDLNLSAAKGVALNALKYNVKIKI